MPSIHFIIYWIILSIIFCYLYFLPNIWHILHFLLYGITLHECATICLSLLLLANNWVNYFCVNLSPPNAAVKMRHSLTCASAPIPAVELCVTGKGHRRFLKWLHQFAFSSAEVVTPVALWSCHCLVLSEFFKFCQFGGFKITFSCHYSPFTDY